MNHLNGLPLKGKSYPSHDAALAETLDSFEDCDTVELQFYCRNRHLRNGLTMSKLVFDPDDPQEVVILKKHVRAAIEEINKQKELNNV